MFKPRTNAMMATAGLVVFMTACSKKTPAPTASAAAPAKVTPTTKKRVSPATAKKPRAQPAAVKKPTPKSTAATPTSGRFTPDAELFVCPKMRVTNRPKTDSKRKVLAYKPFVKVNGIPIAVSPHNSACLTSGFGQRRGRPHKGVDYQGKPAPMVHAAGAGVVREALYRDDYGNVVLIDHGEGVYTRYAHLKGIQRGIKAGRKVAFGAPLGIMGKTSKYKVALHLHYEVLTGNYDTPKKSFGLKAINIFRELAKQ